MIRLSRHPLLHHFTLCAWSLLVVEVAQGGFNLREAAPIPSLPVKVTETPPPLPQIVRPDASLQSSAHNDALPQQAMAPPQQQQQTITGDASEKHVAPPNGMRQTSLSNISVRVQSSEPFFIAHTFASPYEMFGNSNIDDVVKAHTLWNPDSSGFATLTNLQIEDALVEGANGSVSAKLTTHFIQPLNVTNTVNNTRLFKASFITAFAIDAKWEGFSAGTNIWSDMGATYVDASFGYKFKMGTFDIGTKGFVSENLDTHQMNSVVTFELGQKIPGLASTEWRLADNMINTPNNVRNAGSNLEMGVHGNWETDERWTYNAAATKPFAGKFGVTANIGFKF